MKDAEDPKLRDVAINASALIRRNLTGEFKGLGVAVMILTNDGAVTGTSGISQGTLLRCCLHTATHIVDDVHDEMDSMVQALKDLNDD